jgi:hypothetical protein
MSEKQASSDMEQSCTKRVEIWPSAFAGRSKSMNKSEIAETKLPCGCICDPDDPNGPVFWNPFSQHVRCHKCGAFYLVERAIAESQAWISVQETLPEEGRQVLVWMVDDNSKIGGDYEADVQLWEYNKGHPFFPRRKNARSGVTHWMPLPNPPKGNENV